MKMIKKTIEMEPTTIELIFVEALQQIKYDTKKIYVRVHPKTEELLIPYFQQHNLTRVELLPDNTLEVADFVIETDREFIDAKIQSQISELKLYLRGVLHDQY